MLNGRPIPYGRDAGPCAVCGKAGAKACARCRVDFYCGKEHQTQDWLRHKKGCGALVLRYHPDRGRYLEATKDIPKGTVIMRELPMVAVPTYVRAPLIMKHSARIFCVGCCREIVKRTGMCKGCSWPVCSEECSRRPEHQAECAAFQRAKFKFQQGKLLPPMIWPALMLLRVQLASETPALRERLLDLQSEFNDPDADLDSESPWSAWDAAFWPMVREGNRAHTESVFHRAADWLVSEAGLSWLSVKELLRWARVLIINAIHPQVPGLTVTSLFSGVSLLEHACVPNLMVVAWSVDQCGEDVEAAYRGGAGLEHAVVACRDVARGDHLSLGYRQLPLSGRAERLMDLAACYGFRCECDLCADPTDAGLRLSSWYCGTCKLRGSQRLVDLVSTGLRWFCDGCGRGSGEVLGVQPAGTDDDGGRIAANKAWDTVMRRDAAGKQLSLAEKEGFLETVLWPRGPLHPTSQVVLGEKHSMVFFTPTKHKKKTAEQYAVSGRLSGYCRDLLAALETLSAGRLDHRMPVLRRLGVLLCERLDYACRKLDEVAAPRRGQSPLLQDLKGLQQEVAELVPQLESIAITPSDKALMKTLTERMKGLDQTAGSLLASC